MSWVMPDRVRRTMRRLIPITCPPEVDELGVQDDILAHVELSIGALSRPLRAGLVAGVVSYDLGAIARFGRRSHRLDRASAARYFELWMTGPGAMRELAKGMKGLICLAYYELPSVQAAMGYRPADWIAHVDARRRERHADAIEAHRRALLSPDPLPSNIVSIERLRRKRVP